MNMDRWQEFDVYEDDDANIRTLRDYVVQARKEHKCTWCGEKIKIGSQTRCRTDIYDGEFCAIKLCELCCEATILLVDSDGDETYTNRCTTTERKIL